VHADHVHADLWQQTDHVGILCSIWATSVSFSLTSFDDRPTETRFYVVLISAVAIACLVRLLNIRGHDFNRRQARLVIHFLLGEIAILPGLRRWYLYLVNGSIRLLIHFGALVVWNSMGGVVYATHVLDKVIGKRFGMLGVSHHAMHIIVVVGMCMYEQGLLKLHYSSDSVP
jgi:adiponectin receptor